MPRAVVFLLWLGIMLLTVATIGCEDTSLDLHRMQLEHHRADLVAQQKKLQNQFNALSQKPVAQRTQADNDQLHTMQLQINSLRSQITSVDNELAQLDLDQ
ncbi:MAG TPA: hypothetical protein VE988_25225 [Gemmataceae bacterium]|nr:hypothetical protein [Gemmataceae bacterium]